jgi:hypothetical protein
LLEIRESKSATRLRNWCKKVDILTSSGKPEDREDAWKELESAHSYVESFASEWRTGSELLTVCAAGGFLLVAAASLMLNMPALANAAQVSTGIVSGGASAMFSIDKAKTYLNRRKFVLLDQLTSHATSLASPLFQRQVENVFQAPLQSVEVERLQHLMALSTKI